MLTTAKRRILSLLPIFLLVGVTGFGVANALQGDQAAEDLGPQLADYSDEEGNPDVAGYLVGGALYASAPNIASDEDLEFRVFACTEGDPIAVSVVPRILPEDQAVANAELEDDDPAKLAQEPVNVVEEAEALAEASSYEFAIPAEIPLGFARLRVACTGADGAEVEQDTVINVVDRAEFEAAQVDAEEPAEMSSVVDGSAG